MKRQHKNDKKALRLSTETIRKLSWSELGEIAGASNNGCGSGLTHFPTACTPCFE